MTQTKIGHFHSRKAQATSYFKPGCPPFPCAWWPCHHLFFLASDQNRAVRSLEVKTTAEVHARAKRHAFLKTMPLPGTWLYSRTSVQVAPGSSHKPLLCAGFLPPSLCFCNHLGVEHAAMNGDAYEYGIIFALLYWMRASASLPCMFNKCSLRAANFLFLAPASLRSV